MCFEKHSSPGFRAIQAYADAVSEIVAGNSEAAADDEIDSAVDRPKSLGTPKKLQTESHQTVLALPPLTSSNTLKTKKQNLKKNKNKHKNKQKNKNQEKNK